MSLYIFDKDGTLVKGAGLQDKRIRNPLNPAEQVLRPHVFETLAQLRSQGHTLAIASNMSMVANGLITPQQAEALMIDCVMKVGGVNAWRYCGFSPRAKKHLDGQPNPFARDDECRKPHTGMIEELMHTLGFSKEDTIMVGNAKSDEQAAQAAGVRFINAKEFFKRG